MTNKKKKKKLFRITVQSYLLVRSPYLHKAVYLTLTQ